LREALNPAHQGSGGHALPESASAGRAARRIGRSAIARQLARAELRIAMVERI
jgi:hypothetical protein